MSNPEIKFAYFAGEPIGVPVLEELLNAGLKPSLVVCSPDRPAGRGQKLTPPPVKVLAEQHGIPIFQPEKLKKPEYVPELSEQNWDLFVVVAYNKILPEWLIELPKHKTINVHPSLLPLRRGPNPIRSAIIEDDRASIGVSIMLMDKEMDHGPILDQAAMEISNENWPMAGPELDEALARMGGTMLANTIPEWTSGSITPQEQDHEQATFTSKITKTDVEVQIDPYALPDGYAARQLLLKIRGYAGFPGAYFFHDGKRIKIKEAELADDGSLRLLRIIPEGKSEMDYSDYFRN